MQTWMYRVFLGGIFFILALPLLNAPVWFYPPDWGKTMVFKFIMAVLVVLVIAHIARKPDFTALKHPVTFAFGALFCWLFLSAIFSVDPSYSFWGDSQRAGGFINLAFYFAFALITFFAVKEQDWKKIWSWALAAGSLVSLIAILQQLGVFADFIIPYSGRPPSTLGGAIFLGTYLLMLSFIPLGLALQEQHRIKRALFIAAPLLFALVIVISGSRSAYVGMFLGLLYFLFFFPLRNSIIQKGKIAFAVVSLLGIGLVYIANFHGDIMSKPEIVDRVRGRLSADALQYEPRPSAWNVSLQAIQRRPLFGYGPENFSVGFDAYFDPSLPNFESKNPIAPTNWWDRAHNVLLDIGVTSGVPAVLLYLALFAAMSIYLQKIKKRDPQKTILAHSVQATFLAYIVANLLSFDTYPTYIILFLFIGFTLALVTPKPQITAPNKAILWGGGVLVLLGAWFGAVKPMTVQTLINEANILAERSQCSAAVARMERAADKGSTFLDAYLKREYVMVLRSCEDQDPVNKLSYLAKEYDLLKEAKDLQPTHTRTWIFLGGVTNALVEAAQKDLIQGTDARLAELQKEPAMAFERAHTLSPKRQEVFVEWIKGLIVLKDYEGAKQKSQECIALNPKNTSCQWLFQIAQLYTGELKKLEVKPQFSRQLESIASLNQLVKAYIATENYQELAHAYKRLIALEPANHQHHASLAVVYQRLQWTALAKEEARKTVELNPETADQVKTFLSELPANQQVFTPTNAYEHLALADIYARAGKYDTARAQAQKARDELPKFERDLTDLLPPLFETVRSVYSIRLHRDHADEQARAYRDRIDQEIGTNTQKLKQTVPQYLLDELNWYADEKNSI